MGFFISLSQIYCISSPHLPGLWEMWSKSLSGLILAFMASQMLNGTRTTEEGGGERERARRLYRRGSLWRLPSRPMLLPFLLLLSAGVKEKLFWNLLKTARKISFKRLLQWSFAPRERDSTQFWGQQGKVRIGSHIAGWRGQWMENYEEETSGVKRDSD